MSFAVEPSPEISHRTDFSILCNARGYRDAVEVGVDLGVFARGFLARFEGHWLVLVDPYGPHPDFPYDRTGDLVVAAQALAEFHGRFRFVRARSPDCVAWVRTFCRPEFIYIDGSHDEADVAADLGAWWEALPPDRGMLAGHDHDASHPGVVSAVERFARERGLVVRLTHEADAPASWYMYKREPEKLLRRLFTAGEVDNPRAAT
jgi:hypothetical protein